MIIQLAALLTAQGSFVKIDEAALDAQVRAERLQPSTAPARAGRPAVRRASSPGTLDLTAITTICRAAGREDDPGAFLSRLSSAYALSGEESASLRSSCAAYLAGRADARRTAR